MTALCYGYYQGDARAGLGRRAKTLTRGWRKTVAWYLENRWVVGNRSGPRRYQGERLGLSGTEQLPGVGARLSGR